MISRQLLRSREIENQRVNRETNWLEVFPEAEAYVVFKLRALKQEKRSLYNSYIADLVELIKENRNENDFWFGRELRRIVFEDEVKKLTKRISALEGYLTAKNNGENGNSLDIHKARSIPIYVVAEVLGIELREQLGRFSCNCPFHEESTPSLVFYPSDNHFHCFGCNRHGDVIDFCRKFKKCSFKQAVLYLLKIGGSK